MIHKKVEDITEADLQALIDNKVLEGKTIEYKSELPNKIADSKKEFLSDVTSFANTSGGDLIFGIEQDAATGAPSRLTGLRVENMDNEKTRLDNILRSNVEPRLLNVTIHPIRLSNGLFVLLIRVPRSWSSPHRVIFGKYNKFCARNSSGKYEMDVDELRVAFNLSETIIERIRYFRADRIAKIIADDTPVPLDSPHRIVLHLIPVNAFNPSTKYDVNSIHPNRHDKLPLIYRGAENGRYNLDGLFTYSMLDDGKPSACTQLYRNGIIEAVDARMLAPDDMRKQLIPTFVVEEELIQATTHYLNLMSELTIDPPIFIFLSLLNVKGYRIPKKHPHNPNSEPIDRDMLLLPAEIIEEYGGQPEKILKPLFDLVWNACGEPRSYNFDEDGNWIKKS